MLLIDEIRAKFKADQFEFSKHPTDQSLLREIIVAEIREAIDDGDIIEDYPNDKYGPSCLTLGFTEASRPLIKIITVYEPNPSEWIDFRIRR